MILKIQQSIGLSSDGKKRLLLYNEDRSVNDQIEVELDDPFLVRMEDRLKIYVRAEAQIVLHEEVEDQGW